MFIDTHLHLSEKEGVRPDLFIQNAKEAGVSYLILSCCDKESIIEGIELSKKYDCIFLSVGFHPEFASSITNEDIVWLRSILDTCPKIVAVGEIGLDYHYGRDHLNAQQKLFETQLELAKECQLPVVIHTRDAIQDTFDTLKKYPLKGVIHCYSGSTEMAREFIKLGYFLGIGGVFTFSNSKLYEVVMNVGLEHIILETDSPYLAPSPYRGSVNESKNIPIIADAVSKVLHVSLEKVGEVTTQNACCLFDLKIKL